MMLLLSLPLSALASSTDHLLSKGIIKEGANLESNVTAEEFINYAITALTYQHGSESMRAEIANEWVKEGELETRTTAINHAEIARILIRALEAADKEESAADYLASAQKLGLFDGVDQTKQTVNIKDLAVLFDNFTKVKHKDIDNKGPEEVPVEDFLKHPGSFGYQLSPDGNYLAYAGEWETRTNVFVQKMGDDSEPVRVTSAKDRSIADYFWKDDQILYMKDNGGDENFHIYSSSFNGSEEKDLTPYEGVRVMVLNTLSTIKDEILIMMNKENPQVFDVYKLNIKTGNTTHVAENPGNIMSWVADRNGEIRIALASDGVEGYVLYRDSEKDEFKPFIQLEPGDEVMPLGFSKDNQSIFALSNKNRDKVEFVQYDLEANETVIFSHPEVDITNVAYDSSRDKLLYGVHVTDKAQYTFFDEDLEKLFNHLKDKLQVTEYELGINDYNREMTKFIVSISSDTLIGKYYYYDSITDELTELVHLSPWLDPDNMSEMHPISYKSRDGLTIHGYLTIPKNTKPENLPLIVNPHGGPWHRDMWLFNPEVQMLANRGYAVLQVNFRASTGYGKEFMNAGDKQWGLKIQDDITDGVQWAIDQGIADPERIGIYGASFGGYATLAGITFTPDLYAAAVSYVGVSNIFTFLDTVPPYWETMRNMLYGKIGHPEEDKELLTATSPIFHVDKIKTPLFVAQGANDPRVNKAESDQIVEALRARGIEVDYMLKEDEGHGFANIENQIEFYNKMMTFLDSHLK